MKVYQAIYQNTVIISKYTHYQYGSRCFSLSNTRELKTKYDIVISGGGMVGFAAACAIGQSKKLVNKSVLLLEGQKEKSWSLPEEYSNRVCAINPCTRKMFQKLGVWDHISQMRLQPVEKMQIWEACSEAMITFEDNDTGDCVAHIIENDVTLDALKKQIPANVEIAYEAKISNYELPKSEEAEVVIKLENDDQITTEFLVGADGANSLVRKTMGAEYYTLEYDQMAIVATLQLAEEEKNAVAWQKFLPTGPIAILPLSSTRSSLVWSTTKKEAKNLLSLSEEAFTDALNNALWSNKDVSPIVQNIHENWQSLLQFLLPDQRSVGIKQLPPCISSVAPKSRAGFPLGLGHSLHYTAPRVALIGDAAHRVHPLAGQGVNLGFGDVAELVKVLEDTVLLGAQLGDERCLHKYESTRQLHNVTTMASIDCLYRLYSTTFFPAVLLRTLGLSSVDALGPLKKRIMAHASG